MSDKLKQVMQELYNCEINCCIKSFWDVGFNIYIGDSINGRKAQINVPADKLNLDEAADWLLKTAKKVYPELRRLRKLK